jgi:FAD/FMN-containing dehydrogenase
LIAESIALAAPSFTGQLLRPTDHGYDDVRRVHNGLIDKRPAIVARCLGVADVADAVQLARTLGLEVSVRGGGHNVAGRATIDQGLMIDLSPMKGIHVDPRARTVRAQGGVLWRELNRETQLHGLATTGGVVGSTGIAGLTLGGGLGWLMPKYGLALDNLLAADMVMADGSVVRASAGENPDLFWAIRGGGGNFGIAASLEYALHQVGPMITGGVVVHPFPRAMDMLRFFRDTCASLPDEAMLVAALQTAPDGSNTKIAGIVGGHCGSLEEGEGRFSIAQSVRPAGFGHVGACAVRDAQRDDRSRLPEGRTQLLESAVPDPSQRRRDSHAHRGFRRMPVADEPHHHRAFPWRGESRPTDRDRMYDARHRLQPGYRIPVDGSERDGAGASHGPGRRLHH